MRAGWPVLTAIALTAAAALVWHATAAAFSSSTANPANALAAGTVTLADDDGGSALFTATDLRRGDASSRCVAVTYTGSLTAAVRLYVSSSSGTLPSYLDLVVEQGTGGGFGTCSGFTPASTIFTGTLSAFAASATNFASGVGSWAPTGSGQSRTFRITATVSPTAPQAAQHTTAGAVLRWEAQSS